MSNKFKDISIKNRTDYFLNDISNMKKVTNKLASQGLQKKNCYPLHRHVLIKDSKYVKINGVNRLYLIFRKMYGYFEEINKNKSLALIPTNQSKK